MMSASNVKMSRRDYFARSASDSQAGAVQHHGDAHKSAFSHTTFDDSELEPIATKRTCMMSSSNSLPNLADLSSEPVPDVTDWGELDIPFDIYEHLHADSLENMAIAAGKSEAAVTIPKGAALSQNTVKRKANPKIQVGIADKTHFFRHLPITPRQNGMPPLPIPSPDKSHHHGVGFFKSESTVASSAGGDVTMQQDSSSSASVDTKDTMRELAKRVAPVNREGVEFAPLDMLYGDDLLLSVSGSYSMSVDDTLLHDAALHHSTDKKLESFSMSSWSQHTISADVFGSHRAVPPKADAVGEFSREGLLLNHQAPSDQSITEAMLDEHSWNMGNFDLEAFEAFDHQPLTDADNSWNTSATHLTQQALHKHKETAANTATNAGNGRSGRNNRTTVANAASRLRTTVPKTTKPGAAVRSASEGSTGGALHANMAPERAAAVPIDAPSYSYPASYLDNKNNKTNCDASPVLTPIYDPTTGVVYYPHVPQAGSTMPAGTVHTTMPAHLLPLTLPMHARSSPSHHDRHLPVHARSPSFVERQLGIPARSPVHHERKAPTPTRSPAHLERTMPPVPNITEFPEMVESRYMYPATTGGHFEVGSAPGSNGSNPGSSTTTPKTSVKKERNRGSYRCGRCGKPKVNHVCAFVDTITTASQGVQAKGPVLDPRNLQPYPGDRVLTVNPARRSIQDGSPYEKFGMVDEMSHSGSFRTVSRSNSGVTPEALVRSESESTKLVRSNSNSHSGSAVNVDSLSRSGEETVVSASLEPLPRSPGGSGSGSTRPSVAFTQPLAQQNELAQHALSSESDDVFFPTTFPPNSGIVFSSRNSSVNSTYGNESDSSSTCGDSSKHSTSTFTNMLNVDLGLSRFFSFK